MHIQFYRPMSRLAIRHTSFLVLVSLFVTVSAQAEREIIKASWDAESSAGVSGNIAGLVVYRNRDPNLTLECKRADGTYVYSYEAEDKARPRDEYIIDWSKLLSNQKNSADRAFVGLSVSLISGSGGTRSVEGLWGSLSIKSGSSVKMGYGRNGDPHVGVDGRIFSTRGKNDISGFLIRVVTTGNPSKEAWVETKIQKCIRPHAQRLPPP